MKYKIFISIILISLIFKCEILLAENIGIYGFYLGENINNTLLNAKKNNYQIDIYITKNNIKTFLNNEMKYINDPFIKYSDKQKLYNLNRRFMSLSKIDKNDLFSYGNMEWLSTYCMHNAYNTDYEYIYIPIKCTHKEKLNLNIGFIFNNITMESKLISISIDPSYSKNVSFNDIKQLFIDKYGKINKYSSVLSYWNFNGKYIILDTKDGYHAYLLYSKPAISYMEYYLNIRKLRKKSLEDKKRKEIENAIKGI